MEYTSLTHILSQLPFLEKLIKEDGGKSIFDYAQKHYYTETSTHISAQLRKESFLNLIFSYVVKKFDIHLAEKVRESLARNYIVSTAEHMGPLGHPFFFQSALLRGLVNPDTSIINLCTSHVSLGNSSYPRGIVFHGDGGYAPPEYLHLPFFSARKRMSPVFEFPSYTIDTIKKHTLPRLTSFFHQHFITEASYLTIVQFLEKIIVHDDVVIEKNYSKQLTKLNHLWWSELFPDLPDFIPLDAESIVSEILMTHLHENTILTQMMTHTDIQPYIEQYFNGISCCFDLVDHTGTYLFWYLDEDHNRHALWREGDELVSAHNIFRIKMEHEEISYHLDQHHLIPSGLLIYTTLSCYYGVTCLGGFAQGNYLPKIQEAYTLLLRKGSPGEENYSLQSPLLNEDMVFLISGKGQILTMMDIQMIGAPLERQKMLEFAQKMNIQGTISLMAPEITRCL